MGCGRSSIQLKDLQRRNCVQMLTSEGGEAERKKKGMLSGGKTEHC